MANKLLMKLIESNYQIKNNILIKPTLISELTRKDIEILEGFHMNELYLLELDDEYFCGIRANHFAIEFGWNEYFSVPTNETNTDDFGKNILITANHKGNRCLTLIKSP